MNKIFSFENSLLNQKIKEILKINGYINMTDIQQKTIPLMMNNKDVIVQSQTGTGKTLSFVLPIIHNYLKNPSYYKNNIICLVITPTRELSLQISEVFDLFKIKVKSFIGGTSIEEDLKEINSDLKIIVGTPGRLLEILKLNTDLLNRLSYLVLDEADRLINLGFKEKVLDIFSLLPKNKSCGFFSATINDEIRNLSKCLLRNPVFVKSEGNEIPENLCINYILLESNQKLVNTIELIKNKKSIVFFSTCNQVDFFYSFMKEYYKEKNDKFINSVIEENDKLKNSVIEKNDKFKNSVIEENDKFKNSVIEENDKFKNSVIEENKSKNSVIEENKSKNNVIEENNPLVINEIQNNNIYKIHRKMKQEDRNEVYKGFYDKGSLLLCTDIAARGIDFKNIDLVIHFDIPNDFNNIIHRSGRSGRNGIKGNSVLFVMPNEKSYLDYLKIKEIDIKEINNYNNHKTDNYNNHKTDNFNNHKTDNYNNHKTDNFNNHKTDNNINYLKSLMNDTLLDLSVRAFVAYFRSYKEHTLTYILDYTTLNYDNLIDLYMLKKVPGMTELRNVEFKNFPRENIVKEKKQKKISKKKKTKKTK